MWSLQHPMGACQCSQGTQPEAAAEGPDARPHCCRQVGSSANTPVALVTAVV